MFFGCHDMKNTKHCFCRDCLASLAAAHAESSTTRHSTPHASIEIACPLCRTSAPYSSIVPATSVSLELAAHRTTCEACGERLTLASLKAHSRGCAARRDAERRARETARAQWRRHVAQTRRDSRPRDADDDDGPDASNGSYRNRSTFACPLCAQNGVAPNDDHPGNHLEPRALARHVETYDHDTARHAFGRGSAGRSEVTSPTHPGATTNRAAVCPICVSMPWGDPEHVCPDVAAHIRLRHLYDVSMFTDVEADEDEIVRLTLERSVREAGGRGDAGDDGGTEEEEAEEEEEEEEEA